VNGDVVPATETRREHWDDKYATTGPTAVSWYQERPVVSLQLIGRSGAPRSAGVVDVGGGAGTLVDALLEDRWSDLTVLDLSDVAVAAARLRNGDDERVTWLVQDLLDWRPQRRYDLWHDRATFHFLVDEDDRRQYRAVLSEALAPGGTVIVGTFAADGPTHCSGLPVTRYDPVELADALGSGFDVLATMREDHRTPTGAVQPFSWVMVRSHAGR